MRPMRAPSLRAALSLVALAAVSLRCADAVIRESSQQLNGASFAVLPAGPIRQDFGLQPAGPQPQEHDFVSARRKQECR